MNSLSRYGASFVGESLTRYAYQLEHYSKTTHLLPMSPFEHCRT